MSHVLHVLSLPVRAVVWLADVVMLLCQGLMVLWLLAMAAIALVLAGMRVLRAVQRFRSERGGESLEDLLAEALAQATEERRLRAARAAQGAALDDDDDAAGVPSAFDPTHTAADRPQVDLDTSHEPWTDEQPPSVAGGDRRAVALAMSRGSADGL